MVYFRCKCGGTTPAQIGATLGHHSHTQSSWRVAQGIACAADHLLVEFLLGAVRCEASLAECAADHRLVGLGICATLNAAADFLVESCLDTAPARFLRKGTSEYGGSAQEGFSCVNVCRKIAWYVLQSPV